MKRRSFVIAGTATLAGLTTGCLSILGKHSIDPEKVNFTGWTGGPVVVIRNNRTSPVEATLIAEHPAESDYSTQITLQASSSEEIRDVFRGGHDVSTLYLTTENNEIEQRIRLDEEQNEFTFEIHSNEIEYRTGRTPSPHISVTNSRTNPVEFKITVIPQSENEPAIYDTVDIRADGSANYTAVFSPSVEYDVRVEANGMSSSTSIRNSHSNSVSIWMTEDELDVGVSEA
jgi:hypothetical protein